LGCRIAVVVDNASPGSSVGLFILLSTDIICIISAYVYSGDYNYSLKNGLGIVYNDSIGSNDRFMTININDIKTPPELFHINLVSYSF
jgi:hypothetical protein